MPRGVEMAVGTTELQRDHDHSGDEDRSARPDRPALLRLDRRSLTVATGLAVVVFALAWYRHATFRSGTLDLAVFDQAIWKMAHFHAPQVTSIGLDAFADHFSPVLVLFVPLYWLAATPLWLFAAQALAVGAGYLALRPALDAAGTPRRAAGALAVAYVFSPLLWNAALFDFHPPTLAVPFLLVGITCALTDRRRGLILCCVAVLLLRDDLGPAVAAMALVGALRPAARAGSGRRLRLGLAGLGAGWTVFGSELGRFLGADRFWGYHYGYIASSPLGVLLHPVRSAVRLAGGVWRADNLLLVVAFLGPLLLLPLLKPKWVLACAVMMLPLLASDGTQFHSPAFHYGAPLLPFLIVATGAALARLAERGPGGAGPRPAGRRGGGGPDPRRPPGPPGRAPHVPLPVLRREAAGPAHGQGARGRRRHRRRHRRRDRDRSGRARLAGHPRRVHVVALRPRLPPRRPLRRRAGLPPVRHLRAPV